MGKKTDWEEDPDGWSKPIGKKRRGKKNTENADDFASLLPSSTRAGKAYQRSDVTKEDDQKGVCVRLIWATEKKENIAQLSTGTIAAQAVANAAAEEAAATTTHERINAELKPEQLSIDTTAAQTVANAAAEEAAADATTHQLHDEDPKPVEVIASINAELKLEQLSIGTTAAQTITNAAAEKAAAGAAALERAAAEQTVAIDAVEQAAAINADAKAAATVNSLHEENQAPAAPAYSRAGSQGVRARICHSTASHSDD